MTEQDYKHAGELGDLKDTKYWFKRDIGTFKNSLRKTARVSPILLAVALILSLLINYFYNSLSLMQILFTTILFFPIVLLGYFLVYIMVNKGYNIDAWGGGTVIDESRNPKVTKK